MHLTGDKMQTPFPGSTTQAGQMAESLLIKNLPAAQYHADIEVQSCSLLKSMLISPAAYRAQFVGGKGGTKATDFGTLVHTLLLEPQHFGRDYAVYPGRKDGRDSEYKEFVAAHPRQSVIHEGALHKARQLADRMLARSFLGRPFGDALAEAEKEVTIYFTDPSTGVRCRVRIDVLHPEFLCDIKTARSSVGSEWLRHAMGYDYDMQSYMYSLAHCLFTGSDRPLPFHFLVGQSEGTPSVARFHCGESFLGRGAQKYQEAITGYAACSKVNHWPDREEDLTLEIEPWMAHTGTDPVWRSSLATA